MKTILVIMVLLAAGCLWGQTALGPLSVRGTNYYPALTPWGDMWSDKTPAGTYEKDMALAASLGVNTVRTFLFFDVDRGYNTADGEVTPAMLKRFEELLAAADRHGIKLIPCFEGLRDKDEKVRRAFIASFARRYKNDGRILMWDLINEPGGAVGGPLGDPQTAEFIASDFPYLKSLDPKHPVTVGLCYEIYQLSQIIVPDTSHFHDYAPWKDYREQGLARIGGTVAMMRQYAPSRPVIVGEYGWASRDDKNELGTADMTERLQAYRYGICLTGYERYRVEGVLSWCLLDYPVPLWQDAQRYYGCVRFDGSLKPSAIVMKDFYTKWAAGADYGFSEDFNSPSSWQQTENCRLEDYLEDDGLILQRSEAGGRAFAAQTRTVNPGLYPWLTVSLPELSEGASTRVEIDAEGKAYAFPEIKEPGVYEWDVRSVMTTRDRPESLTVKAVLTGPAGCEAMWGRISLGNKRQLPAK
ncbi:MAG: cellulase family glycosylhydrolase [Abditibacteriota bacterium]|nr:cellulase family glycosylhydrolase [Abditibacteriota bacterium]